VTLPIDEASPLGALYGAAKRYPGGIDQLAKDMDVKRSTLYAKLRGEKGYPLSPAEVDEVLNFLRSREVPDWAQSILVFCHNHDHLAIPIPRAMREGSSDGMKQISVLMEEVAQIAQSLAEATDPQKANGKFINAKEWKGIERACNEAMQKIAETREQYHAQHLAAKKAGRVK
jgi:hypothetical protein